MKKEKQIEDLAELIDELNRDVIIGYKPMKNGMIADIVKGRTAEEKAEALMEAGYGNVKEAVKATAREILKILHSIGGCGTAEDYFKGCDSAIDRAYNDISDKYGVTAFDGEDEE